MEIHNPYMNRMLRNIKAVLPHEVYIDIKPKETEPISANVQIFSSIPEFVDNLIKQTFDGTERSE